MDGVCSARYEQNPSIAFLLEAMKARCFKLCMMILDIELDSFVQVLMTVNINLMSRWEGSWQVYIQ